MPNLHFIAVYYNAGFVVEKYYDKKSSGMFQSSNGSRNKAKKFRKKRAGEKILVNPLQPEVFGVKFSLREIGRVFLTKIRNFKLFKMPKL